MRWPCGAGGQRDRGHRSVQWWPGASPRSGPASESPQNLCNADSEQQRQVIAKMYAYLYKRIRFNVSESEEDVVVLLRGIGTDDCSEIPTAHQAKVIVNAGHEVPVPEQLQN